MPFAFQGTSQTLRQAHMRRRGLSIADPRSNANRQLAVFGLRSAQVGRPRATVDTLRRDALELRLERHPGDDALRDLWALNFRGREMRTYLKRSSRTFVRRVPA